MDGPAPRLDGPVDGHDPARQPRRRLQARAVRLRHHLRHQQRVRLRLPPRQHGHVDRGAGAARPQLRHRRRGRLDPHRRGPHAAHHQRPRGRRRPALLPVRLGRARPEARRGLRRRRGEAHRRSDRRGHHQGRGRPRHLQHVRRRVGQPRAPAPGRAAGQGALQARQGLHHPARRGEDRRRVHRPHPRGPTLVRGPAPGRRGQGGGEDQGGEPDPRHGHPPELLPPVRQARRHDRHGQHRGRRARRHLRPAGGAHSHQPPPGAPRPARPHLQDRGRQVRRLRRGHRRAGRDRPAGPRRHRVGREVREALAPPRQAGHPPRGAERQAAQREAAIVALAGRKGRRHRGHQHGRSWRRHPPRRQPRGPGAQKDLRAEGLDPETEEGHARLVELAARFEPETRSEGAKVRELGGLYVLGTERHESRRIDNQLRGRPAARATPARAASTCPSRTSSCACSPPAP